MDLNLALMKKGLRQKTLVHPKGATLFKPCPDEEGIKTPRKVRSVHPNEHLNLALMKKGLRPSVRNPHAKRVTFKPCPDEEGIKTGRGAFPHRNS